jgi:hypothetical protein
MFLEDIDGLSDQSVWAAIQYLDPDRTCRHEPRPALGPAVACFALWFIFFAGLYALAIHTGGLDSEWF